MKQFVGTSRYHKLKPKLLGVVMAEFFPQKFEDIDFDKSSGKYNSFCRVVFVLYAVKIFKSPESLRRIVVVHYKNKTVPSAGNDSVCF